MEFGLFITEKKGSRELVLAVVNEEDNDTLLLHNITPDDIYRKQQETIISWRDPEKALELALSFQEPEGCSFIWENMCNIREDLQSKILLHKSSSSVNGELKELPPLELSSLSDILKILQCGTMEQKQITNSISKDRDFFPKIVNLFRTCEGLGDRDSLHLIFRLVKAILLLNSSAIFDRILSDDFILDIIGVLEYDPEVHIVQRHRAFLKDHAVLKEPIPIRNASVVSMINQTYRIRYIKDVILPKVLDDATLESLNTIIRSNNALVVSLLKDDDDIIQDWFERMRSSNISAGSKSELVFFLREFCTVSKSLPLAQQITLSRDLANQGVFDIVSDVLQSQDKVLVSAGTDILLHFLNQYPDVLRSYIANHEEHSGEDNSLLGLLVKGTVTFGGEMLCQFLEILRMLLDLLAAKPATKCRAVIEIFYKKYFDKLIDIIGSSCLPKSIARSTSGSVGVGTRVKEHSAKPEILLNICEFLCFCVVQHPYKTNINFLKSNSMEKILTLTRRREKFLVVAAVRFMRTVIGTNDEILISHIIRLDMLKPIIEAFVENGDRYNLLHSTALALLEYMRKENKKSLVVYVVESFWNQLAKFEQLKSIQDFRLKYQEFVGSAETEETTSVGHMRKKADERGLGKDEEDYFNTDSNEEDSATQTTQEQQCMVKPANGSEVHHISARPKSGCLMDHDDDKDDNRPPKRPVEADETLNILTARHGSPDGKDTDGNILKKPKLEATISFSKINVLASMAVKHSDLEDTQPPLSPASSTIDSDGNDTARKASPGSPDLQPPESFDYPAGDSSSEIFVDTAEAIDSDP